MPRYLVTGGAGFIGSNIVEELLRHGHSVRILDNFSTGKHENVALARQAAQSPEQLEVYEGDLRYYHVVAEAVRDVDYILHQAALPSVQRSIQDPLAFNDVNVVGTLNLLHAAQRAGVKRVVYASSSSVYGDTPTLPKVETMTPMPLSPYAVSKLTAEQYCRVFWQIYGLETVCLRYFNVFGPRQDPASFYSAVIPKFITAALKGEPVTVHGDGLQSRDFTYISNVVDANLMACTCDGIAGQVMNTSCGDNHTLLDLIDEIGTHFGKPLAVVHQEPRSGDVRHSRGDIQRATQLMGFAPDVDFSTGLQKTIAWYKSMHDAGTAL